jgi:cytochrome b involved in lipid metabolism
MTHLELACGILVTITRAQTMCAIFIDGFLHLRSAYVGVHPGLGHTVDFLACKQSSIPDGGGLRMR